MKSVYSQKNGGDVGVKSQLWIDAGSVGNQASRQVDLSGTNSATLTFDYTNSLSSSGQIEIHVSADGKTYTTPTDGVFSPKTNAGSGTIKLDISGFASANTTIQFIVTGVGSGDRLYVDNLQVSYDTGSLNSAPTISSNGGGTTASVTVAENSTEVTTVTASDVDAGQKLGYSIAGGADAARFTINSSTGQLSFLTAPNYEAPADSGGNNVYDVTVQVSDGQGGADTQAIAVTITNVNEAPTGTDATVTINEDASRVLTAGNFGFSAADAGETMSAVRIDTLPAAGTLTLSGTSVTAGQVITLADLTAGNLIFTPEGDANGTGYASMTFSVRDAHNTYDAVPNTLTFDVTAVNDAPIRTAGTVARSHGIGGRWLRIP